MRVAAAGRIQAPNSASRIVQMGVHTRNKSTPTNAAAFIDDETQKLRCEFKFPLQVPRSP